MVERKITNPLYTAKLLFEPKNGSEDLDFATICRFIRETFNVTQAQMADRLQVRLSSYQKWEYGTREPSSKIAANLLFLYVQSLYLKKQTSKSIEIKMFLDSLLSESFSNIQTSKDSQNSCAA